MGLRLLVSGRFQGLFTPRQGFFSVFARATGSLSVSQEYLALERGRPRFTHAFTRHALLRILLRLQRYAYGAITRYGQPFQAVLLAHPFLNAVLQPQTASCLVWALTGSLAATDVISLISFPPGTKMFQFPGSRFPCGIIEGYSTGLPHSDISGSSLLCSSPELFAAWHVLHRL
jgi:hypothetical protein